MAIHDHGVITTDNQSLLLDVSHGLTTLKLDSFCYCAFCRHCMIRELLQEYTEKKAAGAFEVRRPKTTREIAMHNNQLLQDLPKQLYQAFQQGQQEQEPVAMWSELLQRQPGAPRPTAEEQEAEAAYQREVLLKKVAELEELGVGT